MSAGEPVPCRLLASARRNDRGMVTAELAVGLPALLAVVTIGLSALAMVTDEVRCVDAARVGARLLARGEAVGDVRRELARQSPPGARVVMAVEGERVRVEVSAEPPRVVRLLGVTARPHAVAHAVVESPS